MLPTYARILPAHIHPAQARTLRSAFLGLAAAIAMAAPAGAHVTLDTPQAPAASYVRIAVRVPHGCDGASTTVLRVKIPDGITSVKPQPKPGWKLSIVADPVAAPPGGEATLAVHEVNWRAQPGKALPDAFFDEFVMQIHTPDAAGQTLYFPFVQECEDGNANNWVDLPAEGQTYGDLKRPAYPVRIVPKP